MRAKTYLMQYRHCRLEIIRLEEQIQQLADLCAGLSAPAPDADRVQSSRRVDRLGEAVARMADLQDKLITEVDSAIDAMNQIEDTINSVEDLRYKTLLHKRYIAFKTWEVIAEEMHYDNTYIYELHGQALEKVQLLLNTR